MGNLLAGVREHLFADQLGHQQLLGLIAHRIGWIEVRPRRQGGAEGRHQGVGAGAGEGAHRVQRPVQGCLRLLTGWRWRGEVAAALQQLAVAGQQGFGLGGIHQVGFVERHLHRRLAVAQQVHDVAVAAPGGLAAIHQQQHHIHITDGAAGRLHQPFAQQVVGLVDAGGVQQNQLGRGRGEDGPQAVAGGLGHR